MEKKEVVKIWDNGVIREATKEEIIKMEIEQKQTETEIPYEETLSYGELANLFIRERYTLSEELAIIRQKTEKPDEYTEYFTYCEECKERAKQILGIKE